MASVTLAESAKLAQDDLVAGIIENIITVNQMYTVLPFDEIDGNALAYNRENALGGAGVFGVGDTIDDSTDKNPIPGETAPAKAAATFTQITSGLTTILGDAEVNGLIQATRSGRTDQTATQIASKAKHCGRIFQYLLVNGTGASDQFDGLINLCASGQMVAPSTHGSALALATLDNLIDLVTAKDGVVDYFTMNVRERRAYRTLLRALGGASINEVVELPDGSKVMAYSGVPIFRNDYIPITATQGNATNASYVFAGTFDDGSRTNGLAGLTPSNFAGIGVVDVGEKESADERLWRVKLYAGAALFTEKGLSMAYGIIP
jgi:hypothetical protein